MGNTDVLKSEDEFLENYSKHDIAEDYLIDKLNNYGYRTNEYGIDNRHGGVEYSSRPDLCILDEFDNAVGYVDAKAKSVEHADWMGKLNERSWEDYLYGGEVTEDDEYPFPGAQSIDLPVWLFFATVDEDVQCVGEELCIPVESSEQVDRTFNAWDGNEVVVIDGEYWGDWSDMMLSFNQ